MKAVTSGMLLEIRKQNSEWSKFLFLSKLHSSMPEMKQHLNLLSRLDYTPNVEPKAMFLHFCFHMGKKSPCLLWSSLNFVILIASA